MHGEVFDGLVHDPSHGDVMILPRWPEVYRLSNLEEQVQLVTNAAACPPISANLD